MSRDSHDGPHTDAEADAAASDRTADELERELQQAMDETHTHDEDTSEAMHAPPSPSQHQSQQQQHDHEARHYAANADTGDAAHSHHLSPHAFTEVSLASAPPAAADPTVVESDLPSLLSARCGRSFLYAFLLLLALANLLVSLPQPEQSSCRLLSNYALAVGIVLALSGPAIHCFVRTGREVLMPPFVPYVVLGVLACAALASVLAIGWLAHDVCPADRALRQTVLADVMLVLGTALALAFYALLRWRFPALQLSKASQQVAKSAVLALVLSALVCDIANLVAHAPSGRMNYHWGLGARPEVCQIDCPIPSTFNPDATRRPLQCFNAEGAPVEAAFCEGVEKPGATDLALAPCPLPLCACTIQRDVDCDHNATAYHYAVQFDAVDAPQKSKLGSLCIDPRRARGSQYGGGVGGRWPTPTYPGGGGDMDEGGSAWWLGEGDGGPNLLQHRYQMRLGCRSLPGSGAGEGAWVAMSLCAPFGQFIDPTEAQASPIGPQTQPRPVPAPFTDPYSALRFSLPESPCPQGCQSLWGSAVAFTAVFGCMAIALAVSVLCNCCRRECEQCCGGGRRGETHPASEGVEMHAGSPSASAAAAVSIPNPDDLSVLPSASSSPDPVSSSAAHLSEPSPDASMRSLCLLLVRVLRVIVTQGFTAVAPWWRHALLFAGLMLLLSLAGVACWSMLWLVNANCRDFMLSAIMNAVVTCLLTIAALTIIVRNKRRVFDHNINPFESVGLLQREEEHINRQADADDEHEAAIAEHA